MFKALSLISNAIVIWNLPNDPHLLAWALITSVLILAAIFWDKW